MTDDPGEPITPELVLVSPELRALALRALPERRVDDYPWLPGSGGRPSAGSGCNVEPRRGTPDTGDTPPAASRDTLSRAASYAAKQVFSVALHAIAVVVIVTIVLLLAELIHH